MPALSHLKSAVASSLTQTSSDENTLSKLLNFIRPSVPAGCTLLETYNACPHPLDVDSATNHLHGSAGSSASRTSYCVVAKDSHLPLGSTPASSDIKLHTTSIADSTEIGGKSLGVHPKSPVTLSRRGGPGVQKKGFGLGSLPPKTPLDYSHNCVPPGWLGSGGTLGNGQIPCHSNSIRSFSNWLNKPMFPTSSNSANIPVIIPSSTTEESGSDYGRVAIFTVIGFAAVLVFCITICGLFRCTRFCRRDRRTERSADQEERRRQIYDAGPDLHSLRQARQQERRAQMVSEAAMLIHQGSEAGEYPQYTHFHSSTRSTESSAMWSSAGHAVTQPEPTWQTTRSPTASLSRVTTATTPLPKYEREDPLFRSQESSAEFHPMERSPTYTEV